MGLIYLMNFRLGIQGLSGEIGGHRGRKEWVLCDVQCVSQVLHLREAIAI